MIKEFISRLAGGEDLSQEEATRTFQIIMNGGATPAQIAAILMGLRIKGETAAEIAGSVITMRAKMETLNAPEHCIDVCGTGGDASRESGSTLNVSTAVSLVVAACGVPVAKHGNKSVSSSSGSADVLTALGVNIQAGKDKSETALREAGICFMFAPLYHKSMRDITPVRQELGIRTLFNLLGPLANPAKPKRQLLGVYDRKLLHPMATVLKTLGSEKAWIVHGSDGMDELTISGPSHICELNGDTIRSFNISPEDAGLECAAPDALKGGTPEQNAHELSLLLTGKLSAYRDIVLLNAAAALVVADKVADIKAGADLAAEAIDTRKALETLAELARITNSN
ncbi:MAG TPA: anthranilate phosphoribosyltransferase [Rickettsiales bacterium]|nr:anthranilate phosphoribosyltransferase [Rickettsiales bacterium]